MVEGMDAGRRAGAPSRGSRALMRGLTGGLAMLGALLLGSSSAGADERAPERVSVLGRKERVRVVAPDTGKSGEELARIDTGAVRSSIDTDLARELGLDLDDAEKVTVTSSLGREERPLVSVTLQIGDRSIRTRVTVNDRSHLSSPVLIGRHDLDGFLVDVTKTHLTRPAVDTSAPTSTTVDPGGLPRSLDPAPKGPAPALMSPR